MREFKSAKKMVSIGAAALAVLLGNAALAQPVAPVGVPNDSAVVIPRAGFGGETDVWLAIQLNPAYTANDSRPIPGEVANRTFVRYLDSFSHPIPEQFERQSFTGGSSGGGAAASGSGGSSTP